MERKKESAYIGFSFSSRRTTVIPMPDFGIVSVNKPAGCSSRVAVDRVERIVRPAKAGHAGTLDPLATGVLVICVGQATRLIPYVQRMPKTYRATFLLGRSSETHDIEAAVTELAAAPIPSTVELQLALPRFTGDIHQVPPVHSAVKVAGRRAYRLARAGKPPALAPRTVTIYRLAIAAYEYPELRLDIECGSGTYVRSLGRDLAESLGTAAVMTALERTAIGPFRVDDALPLEDITGETVADRMQSPLAALSDLPRVVLGSHELEELRHGRPIQRPADLAHASPADEFAGVDAANRLCALLVEKSPGRLWPTKTFFH